MDGVRHFPSRRHISHVFVCDQLGDPAAAHLQIYRRCLQIVISSLPSQQLSPFPETVYESHFLWISPLGTFLVRCPRLQISGIVWLKGGILLGLGTSNLLHSHSRVTVLVTAGVVTVLHQLKVATLYSIPMNVEAA
jgi:hypothetical protein